LYIIQQEKFNINLGLFILEAGKTWDSQTVTDRQGAIHDLAMYRKSHM